MTKVAERTVKCAKCGKKSEQLIVFSVNFSLGNREDNENLLKRKQICPYCNYSAIDISFIDENNSNEN